MTILNTAVMSGGPVTHTGGTAETLLKQSDSSTEVECYLDGASSFALRKTIVLGVKRPKVSASSPSGYTQKRNTVLIRFPITLASGEVTVCTGKVEIAADIEMSALEITYLRKYLSDFLVTSDTDEFWENQSLG